MKPVFFLGNSLEALRAFPDEAKQDAGYQLGLVQQGLEPDDWKPMKGIGPGVREIRVRGSTGAFRLIHVATLPEAVYVLHAFQKKTRATPMRDIDLAAARLRDLKRRRVP